jgi:hypothetical protein
MKLTALLILAAGFALGQQAAVRVVVTNEAGNVVSDITVNTTDEQLSLIDSHRLGLVKTPAVTEVRGGKGDVVTPAVDAVLSYPTMAAWWRMLISNNIRSIAGDKIKAVLALKSIVIAAQSAVDAEKEKVAQ